MTALYEVRDVRYSYRLPDQTVPVLRGVNLTLAASSFSCLVGPSGSGKTTLLNLLGLLDKPQEGTILLDGEDVSALPEDKLQVLRLRKIGFVFQAFHLLPTLSVLENTVYFLGTLGWSEKRSLERGEEVLGAVGLLDQRHRRPAHLSAGQCQRAAIARALAKKPEIILADEPTANLDRRTAEDMVTTVKELQRKERLSFIFATHDMHLVSSADRVYALHDGTIHEDGR